MATRQRLAHILKNARTKKERDSILANVLINSFDEVISNMWSHLSDMGMTKSEFSKIVKQVKKRL